MARTYTVTVHTVNQWRAGTDSDVYVRLHSGHRTSDRVMLAKSGHDDLEQGHTDSYTVQVPDGFGPPDAITLEIDGDDDWMFESVEVSDGKGFKRHIQGQRDAAWLSYTGEKTAQHGTDLIYRRSVRFELWDYGKEPRRFAWKFEFEAMLRQGTEDAQKAMESHPLYKDMRELSDKLDRERRAELVQVLAGFLQVPDRQRVGGISEYWPFSYGRGGELLYRKISVADGAAHTDAVVKKDHPASGWTSLAGVTRIGAFLPVPDRQRVGGVSEYWLFHYGSGGELLYRKISVADGAAHTDAVVKEDHPASDWTSLAGVRRIDEILPVPDQQHPSGISQYWVFHEDGYRLISIAAGSAHTDAVVTGDRPLAQWAALTGIDRVEAILAVPDQQRVEGSSQYWVFHRSQYRKISIADGGSHTDKIVQSDRSITGAWTSLNDDAEPS
ncbi:hypothetical protein AF335_09710 [Streptomyces eurocidicus]|uniref:PLAT domain-containing protein n=1 Tax=Streptomyces eurocidicus TaxID=66423 RepID=A0A2N8NWR0_STREU|nr:PLAT/LH2 domain-containing protein [Streptomyces eurocidicus]MBB5118000.1 hypothetical protein [Streptomyces eurocidicus]MBF6053979.1 hypothetical protein [Streptomyces eurocidicus]PNE33204.1 hypothetical protein AF335_09710 [Streptomyces eurocidicus]